MKKSILLCLLLAIVGMMATGCSSCQSEKQKQDKECKKKEAYSGDYDGVLPDFTAGVAHIQAMHRQAVYLAPDAQGKKIYWYETKVVLNDAITIDNIDELHITDVTDVFQTFGPELNWQITTSAAKGTYFPRPIPGLWIEDCDMSDAEIKTEVEDVLQRLKEWNGILPSDANTLVLRLPVGPLKCNPQWVLGNFMQVLFIDAVTGEVTDWCPAFPRKD